jgi:hypothetical protein
MSTQLRHLSSFEPDCGIGSKMMFSSRTYELVRYVGPFDTIEMLEEKKRV